MRLHWVASSKFFVFNWLLFNFRATQKEHKKAEKNPHKRRCSGELSLLLQRLIYAHAKMCVHWPRIARAAVAEKQMLCRKFKTNCFLGAVYMQAVYLRVHHSFPWQISIRFDTLKTEILCIRITRIELFKTLKNIFVFIIVFSIARCALNLIYLYDEHRNGKHV